MGRAGRAYHDGRYLETAERLGQREGDLAELSPRRQAEYGLYRGLSLLMLGDLAGAHRWLYFAYEVERNEPGALKPDERAELDRGWAQLAAAMAQPSLPPGAVVVAPAPTPAAAPVPPAREGDD